ncbi:hypothetical protein E4U12_002303 [Claviceps purpurea]|nr:hypothetical protein E4U12_002303 [Claviceps purpurea]
MASLVSTNPSIAEAFVHNGREQLGEDLCNKYFSSLLPLALPFSRSISRLAIGQRRSYHCFNFSDVNGDDDNMHFSAVPQLFAFTVQAIQAPKPTPDWRSSLYGNTSM